MSPWKRRFKLGKITYHRVAVQWKMSLLPPLQRHYSSPHDSGSEESRISDLNNKIGDEKGEKERRNEIKKDNKSKLYCLESANIILLKERKKINEEKREISDV